MKKYITKNQKETFDLGKNIANTLKGGEVVALYGNLGAGKTTFTTGLVNNFIPAKRVLSPTFIIVRHYYPKNKLINHIIHADLYRLNNIKEIEELGLSEFFGMPKTVVLIEWADKMKHLLPENRTDIFFNFKSEITREINIKNLKIKSLKID